MARGKGRKKKCSIRKVGTEGAGAGETAGGVAVQIAVRLISKAAYKVAPKVAGGVAGRVVGGEAAGEVAGVAFGAAADYCGVARGAPNRVIGEVAKGSSWRGPKRVEEGVLIDPFPNPQFPHFGLSWGATGFSVYATMTRHPAVIWMTSSLSAPTSSTASRIRVEWRLQVNASSAQRSGS